MKKRVEIKIHGNVQGVFFRSNIQERATKSKITGWVKNSEDGTVQAILEGEEKKLRTLIEYCKKGPQGSKVKRIEASWQGCKNEFTEFNTL
jgi:acylphosphatase